MKPGDAIRARAAAVAAATMLLAAIAGAQTPKPRNLQPAPAALTAPVLFVTATSTTNVQLTWSSVPGATSYEIWRRNGGGAFAPSVTGITWTTWNQSVSANDAYYFFIRARNATESADSNIDLATTVAFSDDPIVAGQTIVQDDHIIQLRTAVNYARVSAGLSPATWTRAPLGSMTIQTEDVEELRAALNGALNGVNMPQRTFTDSPLQKYSTVVKKAHIKELRQGVKGVQPGGVFVITYTAVSESYFSPNSDGAKDTTTVTAYSSSADTTWTITVNSSNGVPVRTATAFGGILNYTWDGRNGSGLVQPDGTYTFVLAAADGIYNTQGAASAILDTTMPVATISAPLAGSTFSNIRQNGSTSTTVTGTAADTNLLDWTLSAGPTGGSMTTIATNTSAVNNTTLGTWATGAVANGAYSVRLQVKDRAGNIATTTHAVTVSHFSVSQNVYQINTATGETVTYTSNVPFTLTETLTVKNAAGAVVRTLVNASRNAGTYSDSWNGRNDGNVLLADGAYSYFITVTEGSNTMTWDVSNQMRGTSETQLPYPSCSAANMTLDACSAQAQAGRSFDLWANDPLKIHYSVAEPSRVYVVFTDASETSGTCDALETCVVNGEFRATGNYVDLWSGISSSGAFMPTRSKLTVVRRTSTFPKNVVVLHGPGTAVTMSDLLVTPRAVGPEGTPLEIEFDLATFGNVPAAVTLKMVRQATATEGMSTLRTITLPSQAAGHVTYTWDGKADSGHWVAPGEYALLVTAAANGGTARIDTRFAVIY